MGNKPIADISELIQLCFVGLVGANNEIDKVLKEFHEKYDKPVHGYLFCEFLLHQPLYKKEDKEEDKKEEELLVNTWEFSPFVHRLAKKSLVMIKSEDAGTTPPPFKLSTKLSTYKSIAETDIIIRLKDTFYTQYVYKYWNTGEGEMDRMEFELDVPFIDQEFGQVYDKPFFAFVKDYKGDMKPEKLQELLSQSQIDARSKKSFYLLHGLLWPRIEHIEPPEEVTSFYIPIASSTIFYGAIQVFVPHFQRYRDIDKLRQLASELIKCVKKHYVPALALIHEHFFEKIVSKERDLFEALYKDHRLSLTPKIDYHTFICRTRESKTKCFKCQYFDWEISSDNIVEKYLHKLWQDRKLIGNEGDEESKYIKESLFFRNRLYTDPNMLDVLERFLKPSKAKLRKEEGGFLPSVLVEAPTGAGKGGIPTLIKLFSDCYNRGETYNLNMAALKPDAVAPVAMVGGEVRYEESICGKELPLPQEIHRLKGILREIRKETRDKFIKELKSIKEKAIKRAGELSDCLENNIGKKIRELEAKLNRREVRPSEIKRLEAKHSRRKELEGKLEEKLKVLKSLNGKGLDLSELNPREKLIVKELWGRFPTIVLDELNSLGIDSQGVLLRFLEDGEITPVGGYRDEFVEDSKIDKGFITDFLVVGVMNEDPMEITREKAISFLKREKYVGGLLGDLLYEHIMRIRRLRPDLRARMMRNGHFEMPALEERRGDIPGIFYGVINDVKEDYFPISKVRITTCVLELLMSPELEWPENVRLLQTLTKKVVEVVYEDYEDKDKEIIVVREKHVREAMKEIGMLKES